MNHTPTTSECPGGTGHIENQSSNNLNFPISTHHSKDEFSLICYLAQEGYSVHLLKDGGYLVTRYGQTYRAKDVIALHAIAASLGVCHG
jgi:hypothetical protein